MGTTYTQNQSGYLSARPLYEDSVPKNYMTVQLVIRLYGSHRIPHIKIKGTFELSDGMRVKLMRVAEEGVKSSVIVKQCLSFPSVSLGMQINCKILSLLMCPLRYK